MINITPDILRNIMPNTPASTADQASKIINQLAPKYKMDTPDAIHEFIATIAEESGQLTKFTESMSYSSGRMMEVWPHRFPDLKSAMPYDRNPKALANHVYADRLGNGPEASNDGWNNRGGGAIQLTGKGIYTQYGKWIGVADTTHVADLVRTDLYYSIDSAFWVFAIVKGLIQAAIDDNFKLITERINGGLTDMPARISYYERAKKYII